MTHSRRSSRLLAACLAVGLGVVVAAAPAAAGPAADPSAAAAGAPWLVVAERGATDAVAAAVARAGGEVTHTLPDLSVLAVQLPAGALPGLLDAPGVLGAREDSPVDVADTAAGSDRPAPTRNVYRETVRADRADAEGATGAGVTVALIDTGVAPLDQLASRLVPVTGLDGRAASCVNFTSDPCGDTYGHGTFLASLIAGDGTGPSRGTGHRGTSDADVLDIKIAGSAGSARTSTLLAALQWVVAHRDAYGIDVLNLSLGTPSGASWKVDPLNHAVERAVAAGIAVVVSAGNTGPDPRTVTKPGDDPFVITVGAADDRGTSSRGDDAVPRFSAQGPTKTDGLAKPDLLAPGARLIGLRAPGSVVEQNVPGGVDAAYRRGSGTSMAAAVVSGAVAQLLSARPDLTPAQVKAALVDTARPLAGQPVTVTGSGVLDVLAALAHDGTPAPQPAHLGSGTGSLHDTAGGLVQAPEQSLVDLARYLDDRSWTEQGWDESPFATTNWQTTNWQTTNWQTTNWQTTNWQTTNWQTTNWQTTNWQTTNWQTTNWQTTNWQGTTDGDDAGYGRPGSSSANLGAWE